jgi:hypothetical protein
VPMIRPLLYQHPKLATGGCKPSPGGSKSAKRERRRRNVDREHFGELSRYYPLPPGRREWVRSLLLKEGKHNRHRSSHRRTSAYLWSSVLKDLDDHSYLIEPPNSPTPSTSTVGTPEMSEYLSFF